MAVATLRKPALAPPPVVIGEPWHEDPTVAVAAFYRAVLAERMADLPFLNPALGVEAIGFRRVDGDWLGAVITPWCLQLLLLPGGGTLWQDISAGCRRTVTLPVGALEFIADAGEAALPVLQYCPLIAPVQHIPDAATARSAARDALDTVLAPLPVTPQEAPAPPQPAVDGGRRAFLRGRRSTPST